ncbi:MAG: acyl-CoA thioesterase [Phycisphaeraceae bacterium]|nr:acyl-CoA thioesterase [Phycisphaeraceae bacterium]
MSRPAAPPPPHGTPAAGAPDDPVVPGRHVIRVRYCECDPMGYVHHSVYPIWFEMGRTECCRATGLSYRDMEADGIFLVVTRLEVRFHLPARYDDELLLETTLDRITRVRLEHAYRLSRDGILLTTGTTSVACIDRSGRPRMLPDHLLADLSRTSPTGP